MIYHDYDYGIKNKKEVAMSIDIARIIKLSEVYTSANECRMKATSPSDVYPCYEYLESIRHSIPKELYAYNLRALLQFCTEKVPPEMRLRMLEGVSWEDIMYQDELDAIKSFKPTITIYRGTDPGEKIPGISWALRKSVADSYPFNKGRVFKAVIPKESILVYLAHEEDESEIIAHVTSGYTIIEDA